MKKFKKLGAFERRVAALVVFLFLAFILLFSRLPGRIAAMEKQKKWEGEFYEFAALFSEIYSDIKDRYVEDIDSKKLFEGAIRGMFSSLDPHSQWLSPDSLSQLEKDTEGEFSGVGLHITLKDNILTVIAPIPGSPAAKAGLLPWDRIVEIEGKSTENITLLEAVKKLTGATGSEVKIKIFRDGEPDYMEFKLVRDTIKVDSVYSKVLDGGVGYLRLVRFADDTADDVKKALKEFRKQELKGIVVDLRNNTGGLLDKAVEISGYFLPNKQLVVSTKGRKTENNHSYFAEGDPICTVPMVVLVNQGSASASEIFAGAMQDTKRGTIVGPKGKKTFGKGSVQTISYLKHSLERNDTGEPQLSGMRLTTAKYYCPSGRTIHEIGITPDYEVALTREEQISLFTHGLLGDPDQTKLMEEKPKAADDKDDKSTDNKDEKKDEKKDSKKATDADKEKKGAGDSSKPSGNVRVVKEKPAAKEGAADKDKTPKEFHDTQLEKGIEYLRTNLMNGSGAAKS